MDLSKRLALIAHVESLDAEQPTLPVVSAAQFFDGNDDDASIAANLVGHPGVARFAAVTRALAERPDVQAVLVGITDLMADDAGSWPYSDTLYVLTRAAPTEVAEWMEEFTPDEVDPDFGSDAEAPPGAPPLAPGMRAVRVWWD